jgi:hypothetical protein
VFGRGKGPVATMVKRRTRSLMLVGLPRGDHQADAVADALAAAITALPTNGCLSEWPASRRTCRSARTAA